MKDPRTTPMRAGREVAGLKTTMHSIALGRASLRNTASHEAMQDSELLFGDAAKVFESKDGWSWCQCASDDYVGYVQTTALRAPVKPDHRVIALSTPRLTGPDIKCAALDLLPFNAQVKLLERANGFALIEGGGFIFERHLAPRERWQTDWVATAERFAATPYVWGGKTHAGIDCSGLLQIALGGCGIDAPRDADMQEAQLGEDCAQDARRRGDMVFWNGHVAIMLDSERLIHANSFHMQVEIEPLQQTLERLAPVAGNVTSIKRL